jgi:hypothetical protein
MKRCCRTSLDVVASPDDVSLDKKIVVKLQRSSFNSLSTVIEFVIKSSMFRQQADIGQTEATPKDDRLEIIRAEGTTAVRGHVSYQSLPLSTTSCASTASVVLQLHYASSL